MECKEVWMLSINTLSNGEMGFIPPKERVVKIFC